MCFYWWEIFFVISFCGNFSIFFSSLFYVFCAWASHKQRGKTIKFWWFFSFAGSWLKIVGNKFQLLMAFGNSFDVTEKIKFVLFCHELGRFVEMLICLTIFCYNNMTFHAVLFITSFFCKPIKTELCMIFCESWVCSMVQWSSPIKPAQRSWTRNSIG